MSGAETIHIITGFWVLAESLYKLERLTPCGPGLCARSRVVQTVESLAWAMLAIAGAGALASPFLLAVGVSPGAGGALMRLDAPSLDESAALLGSALLISVSRLREVFER